MELNPYAFCLIEIVKCRVAFENPLPCLTLAKKPFYSFSKETSFFPASASCKVCICYLCGPVNIFTCAAHTTSTQWCRGWLQPVCCSKMPTCSLQDNFQQDCICVSVYKDSAFTSRAEGSMGRQLPVHYAGTACTAFKCWHYSPGGTAYRRSGSLKTTKRFHQGWQPQCHATCKCRAATCTTSRVNLLLVPRYFTNLTAICVHNTGSPGYVRSMWLSVYACLRTRKRWDGWG